MVDAGGRRRGNQDRLEHRVGSRRQLDPRGQVERGRALGEDARPADRPFIAAGCERAAALLQHDDGFLVREAKRGARAGVEPQPARAELARAAIAALLQELNAKLARLPEECIGQHKCLFGEGNVRRGAVKLTAVTTTHSGSTYEED